jgi:hypothetical protein
MRTTEANFGDQECIEAFKIAEDTRWYWAMKEHFAPSIWIKKTLTINKMLTKE